MDRGPSQAGFSMIELMVSVGVLMVGMLGLSAAMIGSLNLNDVNRQSSIATQAARSVLENMRSEGFATLFRRYNATNTDDVGTSPGSNFGVTGLEPLANDADGMVGEIIFPTAANQPAVLSEVAGNDFPLIGRDLNQNGDATDGDVTGDYVLLPVTIRIRWRGVGGEKSMQFTSMLRG